MDTLFKCYLFVAFLDIVSARSERDILMEIYHATDGPNWKTNFNWGTDIEVCSWYGVLCDSDSNIEQLDFAFNRLSGKIPDAFGELESVIDLALDGNDLTGPIPDSLGKLNLKGLTAGANQLSGNIPEFVWNLPNLKVLCLTNNGLVGSIPDSVANLQKLELLLLDGNHLDGKVPKSLANLPELQELLLQNNSFTSVDDMQLSLLKCNLSGNPFACPIPKWAASACKATCN